MDCQTVPSGHRAGAYLIPGENVPGSGQTLRGLVDFHARCLGRGHDVLGENVPGSGQRLRGLGYFHAQCRGRADAQGGIF